MRAPPQPTQPRMSRTLPGTAKPQKTTMRSCRERRTTHRRLPHGRHRHKPHPHNPPHPPLRHANTQWCLNGCGTPQKTRFSQPTRDHHGTHQGDNAEDPPTVRPRHPLPAGSLPRAQPTPEHKAPPPRRGNDTPEQHTATHHPQAPHQGHNKPKMPRPTDPRTPQTQ